MTEEQYFGIAVATLVGGLIIFIAGYNIGHKFGQQDLKREAVVCGVATYCHDQYGNPAFCWNTERKQR